MTTLTEQLTRPREELLQRLKDWENWLAENKQWQALPKDVPTSDADPLRDIKRFVHSLTVGVYPPGDCLLNIAQSFASYLDGFPDGTPRPLELAFPRLRGKQGAGDPTKRERKARTEINVLWRMAELIVDEQMAIEKAAGQACDELGISKPDALTFASYYSDRGRGQRLEEEYRSMATLIGGK